MYDSKEIACKYVDVNCERLGLKECYLCREGYYLDGVGRCVGLPVNCREVVVGRGCVVC